MSFGSTESTNSNDLQDSLKKIAGCDPAAIAVIRARCSDELRSQEISAFVRIEICIREAMELLANPPRLSVFNAVGDGIHCRFEACLDALSRYEPMIRKEVFFQEPSQSSGE